MVLATRDICVLDMVYNYPQVVMGGSAAVRARDQCRLFGIKHLEISKIANNLEGYDNGER
jgi:hypothetical protein